MMKTRYQNSVCRRGWLHKWKRVGTSKNGYIERCERCGKQMNFSERMPNHIYISYHIRSVLRANDRLFKREYPNV